MAAVFTDEGLLEMIKYITDTTGQADLKLHLFVNAHTPVAGDTLAAFTECTLTSYAAKTLLGATWTFATVAHVVTASYPQQTFVFTGGAETVYGYYVTNNGNTKCLWAELFGSAYTPAGGLGSLNLTINLSDLLC